MVSLDIILFKCKTALKVSVKKCKNLDKIFVIVSINLRFI